jgi:hypothetical protein
MDALRIDWTTWKQLMGKETGLGWNSETGTIVVDPTWWDAKIKVSVTNILFFIW